MKESVCRAIDAGRDEIISWGEYILSNPELGYKEHKTSRLVRDTFEKLSIPYQYPLSLTGVKGELGLVPKGFNVCIIGEMDAVKSVGHPYADPLTSAAHACGHNAQIAAMLGAACGLSRSGVMPGLCGSVSFMAVPAEEFVEIDYRRELKRTGSIRYFGGKQQLIAEGAFDDVDIAMMIHSQAETPDNKLFMDGSSLGFMYKTIRFYGREAHGSEPYKGVNALNAAMLALMGIHANRETFKDEDKIRIHPIITNGGELVNTIPEKVIMETYVRGAGITAITGAAQTVDRAVNGAAMTIGADAGIETNAGYLPLKQDSALGRVFEENARRFYSQRDIVHGMDMTGSTDMGDLSHLLPCIQPTMGGFSGAAHSQNFFITNKEAVYINCAKMLAMTAIDLLADEAEEGQRIKNAFEPQMTKDEYLQYLNQ
ncbi:MAG: amidohydrolase [Acetanaerobacterium sp.]